MSDFIIALHALPENERLSFAMSHLNRECEEKQSVCDKKQTETELAWENEKVDRQLAWETEMVEKQLAWEKEKNAANEELHRLLMELKKELCQKKHTEKPRRSLLCNLFKKKKPSKNAEGYIFF